MPPTTQSSDASFAMLREWVSGEGGICNVAEAAFPVVDAAGSTFEIRGLAAAQDLAAGDVAVRVPSRCFLSPATAVELFPHVGAFVDSLRQFVVAPNTTNEAANEAASASSSDMPSSSDDETPQNAARRKAYLARRRGKAAAARELEKKHESHTDFVRSCADDHEFLLAAVLVFLRFGGTDEINTDGGSGRIDVFRRFAKTLPSPDELTNVDFWTEAEATCLGATARIEKHRRRVVEKLPSRFVELDAKVLSLNRRLFPRELFTPGRWWWAIHILGSRCFNYEPRVAESAVGEANADSKRRRRRRRAGNQMGGTLAQRRRRAEAQRQKAGGGAANSRLAAVLSAADAADDETSSSESDDDGEEEEETDTDASVSGEEVEEQSDDDDGEGTASTTSSSEGDETVTCRETFTMVPLADLCNHDDKAECCDFEYSPELDAMTFVATKPVPKGAQIYIRYNTMDAWKFAKYYGFVPTFHKAGVDCFPITVPPLPAGEFAGVGDAARIDHETLRAVASDIALATKRQLFSEQGGGAQLVNHCHVTAKGPNAKLLGVMRLRYMSRDEMSDYPRAFLLPPLSTKNELAVHSKLAEIIEAALAEVNRYDGEDEAPATARAAIAVSVRARDKEVLAGALATCRAKSNECAELLYYGTTKAVVARRAVLDEQLALLRRQRGGGGGAAVATEAAEIDRTVDAAAREALADVAPAWRHRGATAKEE